MVWGLESAENLSLELRFSSDLIRLISWRDNERNSH